MSFSLKACFIIKIIFFLVFLFLSIFLELLYRSPLFDKSLELEETLLKQANPSLMSFFKLLTIFGTQAIILPILLIVFLCFSLIQSYTFLTIVILANYFDNILKIIYGSPRPFWINPNIKSECDGGFGNPSGHSFSSISVYLSLWNIITNLEFFNQTATGISLKILLLIALLTLSGSIMLTRLYLGVHGINQIIYGGTLGFALYYYFFHVLSLHKYNIKQFIQYITSIKMIIIHSVKYSIYIILLLMVYFLVDNSKGHYDDVLESKCPTISEYRKYNNNGLFIGLTLFMLIGGHYGLIILLKITKFCYPNKEEKINLWCKGSLCSFCYKFILALPFCIPLVMIKAISPQSSLKIIFIFKGTIPYLLTGFLFFALYILACIKCNIADVPIYNIIVKTEEGPDGFSPNEERQEVAIEIKIKR